MEARKHLWAVSLAALLSIAARYQTPNFTITAPTPQIAQQVGEAAEVYRREIAREWLGYLMPQWNQRCPIQVRPNGGAGGVTTFRFNNGHVFGWNMSVYGPLSQILDSVLPHEVTHTVFASHFRRPLPRWADEGACTTVEHQRERTKQNRMLIDFIRNGRGFAFRHLFRIKEYPRDPQSMLSLYAHGHSLATFMLGKGGKRKFLEFLGDGMQGEDWAGATQKHYNFNGLVALQNAWMDWVRDGSPGIDYDLTSLASRGSARRSGGGMIYRAQNNDRKTAASGRLAPVHLVSTQATTKQATMPDPVNSLGSLAVPTAHSGDSPGWRPPRDPGQAPSAVARPRETISVTPSTEKPSRGLINPLATSGKNVGRHLPARRSVPRPSTPPTFPGFIPQGPRCVGGT